MKVLYNATDELLARSSRVDAEVTRAFEAAGAQATVVAVGGYGRRELFPYSDVDLLLLVDELPNEAAADALRLFQRRLWDAGLRISASVRTVPECCEIHDGNLELTISLLDQRLLAGNPARFQNLQQRFAKFVARERVTVASHLSQMTRERHKLFGGTIYHLEPNVKEHPGGLRDLHVLRWLSQLGINAEASLEGPRDFLFGVRILLHKAAQRDSNILSFDFQESISADPAEWMREYYRNARQVVRALQHSLHRAETAGGGILALFREHRARLSNSEFTVSRERVLLREPGLFESDPSAVLRLLVFIARHGLSLAPDTERRLAQTQPDPSSWRAWRELVDLPGCAIALRALQHAGLLTILIPEWSRIDALVIRDFYHRYTVDEHTLVTIECLASLPAATDAARKRFAGLLAETANLAVLRLALLLHDIGKGGSTGDHARESVKIASNVLERFQLPPAERADALYLIEHHLDLSSLMSARDLEDPATARLIAEKTGTMERLALLTLLTYADISAVNPQAMTPWRMDQLWRVYRAGREEFTRELQTDRIHVSPDDNGASWFLEGFPVRYARTHSKAEIRAHADLARSLGETGSVVRISKEDGFFRAEVIARDRPYLLASLSGTLAGFGLNITRAEAFSNGRGICLDTFAFSDPHRTLELNPPEMDRLRDMLRNAALGKLDVLQLLKGRPKPVRVPGKRIETSVRFNSAASANAALVEITAQDRAGLLYDLTRTISAEGLNIEVVLINTEAHRALDVFYVTAHGGKPTQSTQDRLRASLLLAAGATLA